jgi:hypothetical protein
MLILNIILSFIYRGCISMWLGGEGGDSLNLAKMVDATNTMYLIVVILWFAVYSDG